MAGSQTHGFDMAIEVSPQTLQALLSSIFDNDDLLAGLFPSGQMPIGFSLALSFNHPSGVPASAVNPVELNFDLTFPLGIVGNLRLVVGVDVDHSSSTEFDWVYLDFPNKLYICDLSISGIPMPLIATAISNGLKANPINLIPVPVKRTSTNSLDITKAEIKIIDDSTSTNNDALCITLTFGGGAAGDLSAFTTAFSTAGSGAALAISFDWLCRNLSPQIESAMNLPAGSFQGCNFNGDFEISDGVRLTSLSLTPSGNSIHLTGTVKKEGTCYEAEGSISADIYVAIVGGSLRVTFNVTNPIVGIDVPWYCWLAAGIIGAILGGVLFGVIGAIVGAIIVPLILWIAQAVIESAIENIASQITNSISGIDLNVPLVGINTVLESAFIDDITIRWEMDSMEYAPVKSEGVMTVLNDQIIDFDNGIVKSECFGGGDLKLKGNGRERVFVPLCGVGISDYRIGENFGNIRRYKLYLPKFGILENIPISYVADFCQLPFSSVYIPTNKIFSIRTSDGCLGFFQIVEVSEDYFVIKYKTYHNEYFTLQIDGNFRCKPFYNLSDAIKFEKLEYLDSTLANKEHISMIQNISDSKPSINKEAYLNRDKVLISNSSKANFEPKQPITDPILLENIANYNRPVGIWYNHFTYERETKTARFKASVSGRVQVTGYNWQIEGTPVLDKSEGNISIKGVKFNYKVDGKYLIISSNSNKEVEIAIKVTVITSLGNALSVIRCVLYKNNCRFKTRVIPTLKEYSQKFNVEYGISKLSGKNIPK